MRDTEVFHLKNVINSSMLLYLREQADLKYKWIADHFLEDELPFKFKLPDGGIYVKMAHSLTLDALFDLEELLGILKNLLSSQVFDPYLDDTLLINLSQLWLRRQFPLEQFAQGPHQWHQDGALAYDFVNPVQEAENQLLDMITLWFPLMDCGVNAPGLEFVSKPQTRILSLDELKESAINAKFSPNSFVQPICNSGDVLLFGGNILHRTHVLPGMKNTRTSIGIRIFNGIPERCANDQFVRMKR